MSIIVRCTHCGQRNRIPDASSGVAVCGSCGTKLYCSHNERLLHTLRETELSPVFLCFILICVFSFLMLSLTSIAPNILAFLFVATFWLVSLIIHEYMHAASALYFGDEGVIDKEYLKLDLRKYFTFDMSLLLPVIIFFNGGIGFPGAAVWIDQTRIRTRMGAMLISILGPLSNIFASLFLALVLKTLILLETKPILINVIAFSLFLQIQAGVLNLLPIPGLDGFGALRPFIPSSIGNTITAYGGWILMGFFYFLFVSPDAGNLIRVFLMPIADTLGAKSEAISQGYRTIQFWK